MLWSSCCWVGECRMKYYNGCLFHKVEKDFLAQTGDRTGTGTGGDSLYKLVFFFSLLHSCLLDCTLSLNLH